MPLCQRQKEKRVAENEMAGWHHWFNGHKLGQTPGDSEGQEGLVCCSSWGHKESSRLSNWTTTNTTVIKLLLLPKTHMWYFRNSYLLLNMHLDVMQKIILKWISFYLSNKLRKSVLFSPFYRKDSVALWGGDGKRESWDRGLKRETVGSALPHFKAVDIMNDYHMQSHHISFLCCFPSFFEMVNSSNLPYHSYNVTE